MNHKQNYIFIIIVIFFIILGIPAILNYFNLTDYWSNYLSNILVASVALLGTFINEKLFNKIPYRELNQDLTDCLSNIYQLNLRSDDVCERLRQLCIWDFLVFNIYKARINKNNIQTFKKDWKQLKDVYINPLSYRLTILNVDFDKLRIMKQNFPEYSKYMKGVSKCRKEFNTLLYCAIPSDIIRVFNGYTFDDVMYMIKYMKRLYLNLESIHCCVYDIQKTCQHVLYVMKSN